MVLIIGNARSAKGLGKFIFQIVAICFVSICAALTFGCAHDNTVNASLISIPEKPSAAQEADQYVETAGKVLRFIGLGAE